MSAVIIEEVNTAIIVVAAESRGSNASRKELTVALSNEKALGLTKCQETLNSGRTPQVTC